MDVAFDTLQLVRKNNVKFKRQVLVQSETLLASPQSHKPRPVPVVDYVRLYHMRMLLLPTWLITEVAYLLLGLPFM